MKILIVEDDRETANYLAQGLKEAGHIIDIAYDGDQGLALGLGESYDVIVLDRMLPQRDGLEVVAKLRSEGNEVPILILSALSEVDDRVKGLVAGSDDYLPKPYSMAELLARVEALAKRPGIGKSSPKLIVADLTMDQLSRSVTRAGQEIPLQPREYLLLEYLLRNADKVVTRTMLLENVWNYHFDPQTNVIDVHISRLRNKIDKNFAPTLLHTIRGAGYIIRNPKP